ncbi:replication restart DNA helicase PriA [Alteromonadaceae bacterium 2753L.S.0a.02]|nr:replication restart DNA helicase PriA [Alteromonadaceae bacterium 2753L.S.0a.02]
MTANEISERFISVALPVPLRTTFDYRLPDNFVCKDAVNLVGARVRVPFGPQELIGVIISNHHTPSFAPDKIKPAYEVLDDEPLLPNELLKLCWWAANYYHHPIGETLACAIPQTLRNGKPTKAFIKAWVATRDAKGLPLEALKGAPKQQQILQIVLTQPSLTDLDVQRLALSSSALASLEKKGLLERTQVAISPTISEPTQLLRQQPLALNEEQRVALDQISFHRFACYLLEGATGSGKTEVYLQAISRVLQAGKQALVLIPEIGLTPQTVRRFEQRFCCNVAELHSNISDAKRTENWLAAKHGRARIVIGTRLASLCPTKDLGIIIVDEEHDISFKQQDGLHYSARDLSIYRARCLDIPIMLGSATPSLESFYNAICGKYQHLRLTQRAGDARPPEVQRIDLREQMLTAGLSNHAIETIESTLEKQLQVMVFVNRRGFAPYLLCHSCGWSAVCASCDASMTLHHTPYHLHCHHCDAQRPVYRQCPSCGSPELNTRGQGTEQTEQWLESRFAKTPIIRVDRDSTRNKHALQNHLSRVEKGEPCILIGTQMLAKGHHFPNLALVVIADCDQGLMSSDYRGAERMAQLIMQVAGRAGRGEMRGKVLLQSHAPDHPLLELLLAKGYHMFARRLLDERQTAFLPPLSYQCVIRAESKRPENATDFLKMCRSVMTSIQQPSKQLQFLGPIPARMERVNERFRYQLHITAGNRKTLQTLIKDGLKQIDQHALSKRTRWSIDVDPCEH